MVSKQIIIFFSMTSFIINLLFAPLSRAEFSKFKLQWVGNKNAQCAKLIHSFLKEFRSIAIDQVIELEAFEPQKTPLAEVSSLSTKLNIQCQLPRTLVISENKDDSLKMVYLFHSQSFDSLDWLAFQKKYLRSKEFSNIITTPEILEKNSRGISAGINSNFVQSNLEQSDEPSHKSQSIFRRWWFWGALTGLAGGAVYFTQVYQPHSHVKVRTR